MKYKLNEYHKNITIEELIEDLQRVAAELNIEYVSMETYAKNGKFSATPYIKNFGTWIEALNKAGLSTRRSSKDYKKIGNDILIDDIRNVASKLGKTTISTKDYKEEGKYSIQTILSRYNSWDNALKEADLKSTTFKIIKDEDLYNEIERLWTKKGSQPTTTDIKNGDSIYSLNTFSRRFGGWRKALESFIEYINDIDSEIDSAQPKSEIISTDSIKSDNSKIPSRMVIKRHTTARDVNTKLRFKILQRDNFKCCACGASPAKDPSVVLHVDHIIPWSKGGETVEDNLQTLCSKCNLGKGDGTFT